MTAPPDDTTTDLHAVIAALRAERDAALSEKVALTEALATRNSEYGERIEQQAATVDVLKIMAASPGDPQPVFDLIARRARDLCNTPRATLYEFDGELVHLRSRAGTDDAPDALEAYKRLFPMVPTRGSITCRAILDRQIIHVRDLAGEPGVLAAVRNLGHKSQISVPLLRDGAAIGAVAMPSAEIGGFSDSQVALLQTFAEQAVIAITSAETYRALQTRTSDLQETLEYQTATSDVLKVISRSTFDLQAVLDTLVATAAQLCGATSGFIATRDEECFRPVATVEHSPEADTFLRGLSFKPGRGTVTGEALLERRAVHVADIAADPAYASAPAVVTPLRDRPRSHLSVPLLRESELIGVITLARSRVEPFTDRQIELVSTFADQAVIAIENTRLINEQREALEQQTATAEVLQVINASPGNLAPVFEAILEKATRLCDTAFGILWTYDGELYHPAAVHGPAALAEFFMNRQAWRPAPETGIGRHIAGEDIVHFADLATTDLYAQKEPGRSAYVELGQARTAMSVALRKDNILLGAVQVYRQEVRSFGEREIALLQSFAAQAVIAMENARLLTEQREALEQQTATAEVLQVINASPGNLAPVFDVMLDKAMRLCDAAFGYLATYDGERFHHVGGRGLPPEFPAFLKTPSAQEPGSAALRVVGGEAFVHITDLLEDEGTYQPAPVRRASIEMGGARTQIIVPLRRDGVLLGILIFYRQQVRPFTDKQITLLQNFAAQAVIAMENARLLTEQREALEQQTATADLLQIINASPGSLEPVFDALLEKSLRLCEAEIGILHTYNGELLRLVATRGVPHAHVDFLMKSNQPPPGGYIDRIVHGENVLHLYDVKDSDAYRSGDEHRRAHVDLGGARTSVYVALRKDNTLLGVVVIFRQEVRPFSDKNIALLRNFASQAVIAMENARLLNEVRQRQEELRITFENMGDGVALFDETRHLVASNQRFQHMLDVPDDVIASRPAFSDYIRYLADHGEYGPEPEDHVQQLLALGSQRRTFERTRPNGRIIEIRVNPVPGGGFVVIYSDITERKRNEEETRAARDAAEEASRTIEAAYRDLKAAQANLIQAEKMASLGQLTAGIAHEIKNPLNFVNNFAELSGDLLGELNDAIAGNRQAEIDELTATLQGNLAKITEHGKRADGIVRSMLEHSRGSSGERRMVDLNALIDDALNLAYHGARAQDQSFNITIERGFAEGIAPIEVAPQDMTRVFLNLFSNGFYAATRRARKDPDAGFTPTLKVTTRDIGEAVEIHVRDNGIGISADITSFSSHSSLPSRPVRALVSASRSPTTS